jgi:hypothetical protein
MNSPVIEKQPSFDTWPQARKLPETITVEITHSPHKTHKNLGSEPHLSLPHYRHLHIDCRTGAVCPALFILMRPSATRMPCMSRRSAAPPAETAFLKAIHKYLDKQYQGYIKQFESAKATMKLLLLWQHYFSQGKIAGPLWAALTHKRIGDASQARIHDCHTHAYASGSYRSRLGASQATGIGTNAAGNNRPHWKNTNNSTPPENPACALN